MFGKPMPCESRSLLITGMLLFTAVLFGDEGLAINRIIQKLTPYSSLNIAGELTICDLGPSPNILSRWKDKFVEFNPKIKVNIVSRGLFWDESLGATNDKGICFFGGGLSFPQEKMDKASKVKTLVFTPAFYEALAVIVPNGNNISSIDLPYLSRLFGEEDVSGTSKSPVTFPFSPYGREDAHPQTQLFVSVLSGVKKMSGRVRRCASTRDLIEECLRDSNGIGFMNYLAALDSGISDKVRVVPIKLRESDTEISMPVSDGRVNIKYPFIRVYHFGIVSSAGRMPNPAQEEFMKFIISAEGQKLAHEEMFIPVSCMP